MVKLNDVLYIPQYVKNLIILLSLVAKGYTMGATIDKMTIKKKFVSITLG